MCRELIAAEKRVAKRGGLEGRNALGRRLIAFVGGIDLCDGRFDTPRHSLFHTLNTVHTPPDFYQHCIPGWSAERGGKQIAVAMHLASPGA